MTLDLLQQAPGTPSMGQGLLQMVPFLLVFFIIYWVLILGPMRKQQKKTREMLSALKKGDRVVTSGGIHGTVAQVEEAVVWVKIAETAKVKINKSAIASVVADGEVPKDAAS